MKQKYPINGGGAFTVPSYGKTAEIKSLLVTPTDMAKKKKKGTKKGC